MRRWLGLLVAVALGGPVPAAADPLTELVAMEAAYARVTGYVARFERQEMVAGTLRPREEAVLKYQRPGRIYLRWTNGPAKGREMLFVEGRHDNRVLVREPGLLTWLFTVVLAPDSPLVLRESRHPVTDVGLGRLIELIMSDARRAAGAGELSLVDKGLSGSERRLELVLPRDPARGYYCHRLALGVAADSGLPVRATVYDGDDRMVADYAYRDLRLNPTFSATEFNADNPEYGFPRWRVAPQ